MTGQPGSPCAARRATRDGDGATLYVGRAAATALRAIHGPDASPRAPVFGLRSGRTVSNRIAQGSEGRRVGRPLLGALAADRDGAGPGGLPGRGSSRSRSPDAGLRPRCPPTMPVPNWPATVRSLVSTTRSNQFAARRRGCSGDGACPKAPGAPRPPGRRRQLQSWHLRLTSGMALRVVELVGLAGLPAARPWSASRGSCLCSVRSSLPEIGPKTSRPPVAPELRDLGPRKAPLRCPVSCASTRATWNRQPTRRDTFRSARYSLSVTTTRTGFFSTGFLRPFSGFLSRSRRPCSVTRRRRRPRDTPTLDGAR